MRTVAARRKCRSLPLRRRPVTRPLAALLAFLACGLARVAGEAATLRPEDAASHIGQPATVCGVVASTKFDAHLKAQPTFLDFGKPYPDQVFTAVIFGADRAKFATPETAFLGKRVCVAGTIGKARGKPEIVVTDPAQLTP